MTLKEQLIGVWSLESYQSEDQEGNVVYPFGEDAMGFIMYHPDGYMSAQLSKQGRAPYASGDIHVGTTEEMANAAVGYMAYCGKFEVNEETGVVTHHMEVSMNPTWEGQQQPRLGKIESDVLKIMNGLNESQKLVWKKCPKH